jgi:hypothetical protein
MQHQDIIEKYLQQGDTSGGKKCRSALSQNKITCKDSMLWANAGKVIRHICRSDAFAFATERESCRHLPAIVVGTSSFLGEKNITKDGVSRARRAADAVAFAS